MFLLIAFVTTPVTVTAEGQFLEVGPGFCRDAGGTNPWSTESSCKSLQQCMNECGNVCRGIAWSANSVISDDGCRDQGLPRCIVFSGVGLVTSSTSHAQDYTCYRTVKGQWQLENSDRECDNLDCVNVGNFASVSECQSAVNANAACGKYFISNSDGSDCSCTPGAYCELDFSNGMSVYKRQNVCNCANGAVVTDAACPFNGATRCSSCTTGYNGVACVQNVCNCENGAVVNGVACTTNGATMCSSCNTGYSGATCVNVVVASAAPPTLELRMTVEGVTYDGLVESDSLLADFINAIKRSIIKIAAAVGEVMSVDDVSVVLERGSVLVHSTIAPPVAGTPAVLQETFQASQKLPNEIIATIEAIPEIDSVKTGTISIPGGIAMSIGAGTVSSPTDSTKGKEDDKSWAFLVVLACGMFVMLVIAFMKRSILLRQLKRCLPKQQQLPKGADLANNDMVGENLQVSPPERHPAQRQSLQSRRDDEEGPNLQSKVNDLSADVVQLFSQSEEGEESPCVPGL